MTFVHGFELIADRHLAVRVWRERDTFSGGVNLSARERNAKRVSDSRKVYVMGNKIIGAPMIIAQLEPQLAKLYPLPPLKDPDDAIDELYAEQQDLREDHPRYQEFYDELSARILVAEEKRAEEMDAYFKARNPTLSPEEVKDLLARVDAALKAKP